MSRAQIRRRASDQPIPPNDFRSPDPETSVAAPPVQFVAEAVIDESVSPESVFTESVSAAAPDFAAASDFDSDSAADDNADDNGAFTLEAIEKAIDAHNRWSIRLRCAIETGRTVFTPETTHADRCPMGALLSPHSVRHQTIREIHDDFHREVGRILTLAVRGRRAEAREELETNPDFAMVSAAFTGQLKSLAREITLAESPELLDSYR